MTWAKVPRVISVDVEALSRLVDRIGSTDFDIALLHFINDIAPTPVMEVCGYVLDESATPKIVGWCGMRADAAARIESYVAHGHKNDPVLSDIPKMQPGGAFFVRTISEQTPADEEFRHMHFEMPKFRSEVAIIRREMKGWNLVKLSLEEFEPSDEVVLQLGKVAALVYPIGKQHALDDDRGLSQAARPNVQDRLSCLLKERFPQLTPRERQVCMLTILGNTTQAVAKILSISPNTVITYRQRVYDRLGVSNTSALVGELL